MKPRTPYYWLGLTGALLGATLVLPRAGASPGVWAINASLEELLSGIDFIPTRLQLDTVDANSDDLIAIARDHGQDPGLRIRSYRALSHYSDSNTKKALTDAIDEHGAIDSGVDTIYVRAAMNSLAVSAGVEGVTHIKPMLSHASRDVRATAAAALAVCGSNDPEIISLLRERVNDPLEVAQVKTACIEAIRALTELK